MRLRSLSEAMLLGVACVALMSGCSRERIDWKSAESADTPEGYNHFLERHPEGELATQARARLAQLLEEKDWQRASSADTAAEYKQFLAAHPDGKFAEEARIRVENFSLDANASPARDASASSTASTSGATPGTAAPGTLAEPPTASASPPPPPSPSRTPGPPSKPAPVAPTTAPAAHADSPSSATAHSSTPSRTASTRTAAGDPPAPKPGSSSPSSAADSHTYGIQLGAFSSQAAALTEWKRLQVKFDPQLHGLFAHAVPAQVTSGTLFRLQSPVGEESRARSICAALTQQQQPCVVVLPNAN